MKLEYATDRIRKNERKKMEVLSYGRGHRRKRRTNKLTHIHLSEYNNSRRAYRRKKYGNAAPSRKKKRWQKFGNPARFSPEDV